MTIKSNEDGQTRYVKHYMTDRWFPRIVGSVGRSTYTSWIWINWCEAGVPLACSRLRDGGGKSFSNKKCESGNKKCECGACTHFFYRPVPVYPPPPPFPSRAPLIFALLLLIRWFPLYYLRAWHRLGLPKSWKSFASVFQIWWFYWKKISEKWQYYISLK